MTFLEKNNYYLINYLINAMPYVFYKKIELKEKDNTLIFCLEKKDLYFFCNFLHNHSLFQFKTLIAITVVDYPENSERFEVNYFLLSYKLNLRIVLKITSNGVDNVSSLVDLYKGALWYEREAWDLFGVFFSGNPDLRRILTDYGFEGNPFRKDFPQIGYLDLRYDIENKGVIYDFIEVAQEYRLFDFKSPWNIVK